MVPSHTLRPAVRHDEIVLIGSEVVVMVADCCGHLLCLFIGTRRGVALADDLV